MKVSKMSDAHQDALIARALAMIVIGQRGRFDDSSGRLETDCDGVGVSISTVSIGGADYNCLSVSDGAEEVLAVTWPPDESRLAVGAYSAGPWEDRIFRAARKHMRFLQRVRWRKRQRQRGKG
jgi:hypothetical protein